MLKKVLFTPGPSDIPPEILASFAEPMIYFKSDDFKNIFRDVMEGLRYVFQTKQDVFCFTSTGTGSMEASLVNVLSPGDTILMVRNGRYGERWTEIAKSYDAITLTIDTEPGSPLEPEQLTTFLKLHKGVRAIFLSHCETSTGVVNDLKALASVVHEYAPEVLIVVDAMTTIGVQPFYFDEWGIDIAMTGSQKGLMLPPGLGCVAISEKAWKRIDQAKSPKYYWDFRRMKHNSEVLTTSFTPAVTLIRALAQSLEYFQAETLKKVWARHERLSDLTRKAIMAIGLQLFATKNHSCAVTSVKNPGIDIPAFLLLLQNKYGTTLAGGQGKFSGKLFRIGHMGFKTEQDIIMVISSIERALLEIGFSFSPGAGVFEIQKSLCSTFPDKFSHSISYVLDKIVTEKAAEQIPTLNT